LSQLGLANYNASSLPSLAVGLFPTTIYKASDINKIRVAGAVGIESTNYMEIKKFCGAARPSKSFKGTQWNPSCPLIAPKKKEG
jgi:hypothetical protein